MLATLLSLAASTSMVAPPANVVVFGPGAFEVQLLTAKLAAEAGFASTAFVRSDWVERGQRMMYGSEWASMEGGAALATTNSDFQRALGAADALILCAEAGGSTDLANTLRFAPRVKRMALLTSIGGSRGRGGNMGEGGPILKCEQNAADLASKADVELATVRVGYLKGGGGAYGLDGPSFYDTLTIGGYPTPSWQCAKDYDVSTLGVSISAGDTIEPRSQAARSSTRSSTEACRDEASRINAAAALLACVRFPTPLEISLSAEAANAPPTQADWDIMLSDLDRSS